MRFCGNFYLNLRYFVGFTRLRGLRFLRTFGLDYWTLGPLDYWTIFLDYFLDYFLDEFLDDFFDVFFVWVGCFECFFFTSSG